VCYKVKIVKKEHEIGSVRSLTDKFSGEALPPVPNLVEVLGHKNLFFFVTIESHLLAVDLKEMPNLNNLSFPAYS
jgi:hypothetical protein